MTSIRLAKKAYVTLNELESTTYKMRVIALNNINECGFSLLLLWIRIEMLLKVLRYHKSIQKWPDTLDFITKRWKVLNRLNCDFPNEYKIILENNGASLRSNRNKIAHIGLMIDIKGFLQYKEAAELIIRRLETLSPNKEALLRKKRNSDAQIERRNK